MTLPAIIFMVLAIAIIWGGLAVAIVFLARHPLPPEEAPDTGGSRPVGGAAGAA
ncbi:MAG TPA: methionine/alanine import family NSS transporter small subunit [Actinomycetaceae bacterium]|nr:methionine/alanine import family NSS transporter small subunit [Actinomycetaceae bacterium]